MATKKGEMMKRVILSVACVAMVFIAGCGESESQKKLRVDVNLKMLGEKYVKAKLKDPESAEFRNQFIGKKGAPCGEVNAKNSFGGFIGFQRYISVGADLTVMSQDMAPGEFDISWSQICK